MDSVTVEPQGEFVASPITIPRLRLNVICPYYTMFPISFPMAALADAKAGERVLDPFCGRGTTAYAARLLGLPTVGIDADRVAVTIAKAKLAKRTLNRPGSDGGSTPWRKMESCQITPAATRPRIAIQPS
jgi:2-polyprenyl-3-methyl-5-hydroxy-6-metoxy-1,4-benzoquinol methylase